MSMKSLRCLIAGLAASSVMAATALSVSTPAFASGVEDTRQLVVTALDYNSTGWTYLQVPSAADVPLFYERGFDDSTWQTGQSGFGTATGCSFNNPTNVKTPWAVNTDILVRHWFHIPRDAQQVRIQGTVDNDAQVYLNGHLVQTAKSGHCKTGAIDVVVPAGYLDCCNLLAIRGHDYGGSTYLNVRVTYVKPTQS
ncbi:hypothetical protein GCM10010517_70180 [Streptosporangium fragile]|uniref:Glycosyl hydrolases family 2 sugar binding domain-containing protein n=1 Tax=Streptosporangium fragile TaxID=46186 RepID=A0ABN3WA73_9ACTN